MLVDSTLKCVYVDIGSLEMIYTFEIEGQVRKNLVLQFSLEYCDNFDVSDFSPSLTGKEDYIVNEVTTHTQYSYTGIVESLVIKFLDCEGLLTALWTKEAEKHYEPGCTIKDEIAF